MIVIEPLQDNSSDPDGDLLYLEISKMISEEARALLDDPMSDPLAAVAEVERALEFFFRESPSERSLAGSKT